MVNRRRPNLKAKRIATGRSPVRTPVPVAVADKIRDEILQGLLQPGERITETRLSKQLNVGQPTIREALLILEHEGLVQRVPNLGTFVRELDIQEVSNLYGIRCELEGLATELAARKASDEDRQELSRLVKKMEQSALKEGKLGYFRHDLAFHRRLWQLAGNPQLAQILEKVVVPLFTFSFLTLNRTSKELAGSARLHSNIVDALHSSPENARKVMQDHMRIFLNRYLSHVLNLRSVNSGTKV